MQTRKLGRTGPQVSAIGLGCMPMSGMYGKSDDNENANVGSHDPPEGSNEGDASDRQEQAVWCGASPGRPHYRPRSGAPC